MTEADLRRDLTTTVEDHRDALDDAEVIEALEIEADRVRSTANNHSLEAYGGES